MPFRSIRIHQKNRSRQLWVVHGNQGNSWIKESVNFESETNFYFSFVSESGLKSPGVALKYVKLEQKSCFSKSK